jgi:dihydroorotate dehydrogenase (fumarate)
MARKGFDTVGEMRGKLAVPLGADETAHQRTGYVAAMRAANLTTYGPW